MQGKLASLVEGLADPAIIRRGRDEREFLPAAVEVLETPPSPVGRATMLSICAFAVLAIGWSIVGTIDIVATAQGKIVPSGRTKIVQPAETGVVRGIHVREGQIVKAGDVLVELDPTIATASRQQMAHDLAVAELDIARIRTLIANPDNPAATFRPPGGLPSGAIETALSHMRSRTAERVAELRAIDAEISRRQAEAQATLAQIAKLRDTIPLAQRRAEMRRELFEKRLNSELLLIEAEHQLVEQRREVGVLQNRVKESEAAAAAARAQRTKMEAEFLRSLHVELADAEKRAAAASQELVKAEQRRELMTLLAPVDGTVQQLVVNTIGGVVTPAQALMAVVPTENALEVEAFVLNKDAGFVGAGQRALVKIETFNFTKYGGIEGEVLSISGDAIDDKQRGPVYSARVALAGNSMRVDGRDLPLSPGLAVNVEIKTGERRLIEYVLTPLLRYRDESLKER